MSTPPRPRSVLDGFFHPAPEDPAGSVLRACAALGARGTKPRDRSFGRVRQPVFLSYRRGLVRGQPAGIGCERIFGPLRDLCCRCGKYQGAAHAGTRCEKCRVLCGSPELRTWRFGHIRLVAGVVHPRLVPSIAGVLGWSAADVADVAALRAWVEGGTVHRSPGQELPPGQMLQSGIGAIAGALAAAPPGDTALGGLSPSDLIVHAVPVLPPGDRPPLALDDPTVLVPPPGAVNEAYLELVRRSERLARLHELNAPEIILVHQASLQQEAFDALYAAVTGAGAPQTRATGWPAPDQARDPRLAPPPQGPGEPWEGWPTDLAQPLHCLWLDPRRALLQFPDRVLVVSLEDGAVLAEHAVSRLLCCSTDAPGRRVVFLGGPVTEAEPGGPLLGLAVLDVEAGAWLDRLPRDLCPITVVHDQPEDLFLHDPRDGRTLKLEVDSDRPALFCFTRDHRFVWVGGDREGGQVLSTGTGLVHVEIGALDLDDARGPYLTSGGTLLGRRPEGMPDRETDWPHAPACAVALTPGQRWRVCTPEGTVAEGDDQLFTLAVPAHAAAFSPDASRLLVLTREEALVIEVRPARVERRLDPRSLRSPGAR